VRGTAQCTAVENITIKHSKSKVPPLQPFLQHLWTPPAPSSAPHDTPKQSIQHATHKTQHTIHETRYQKLRRKFTCDVNLFSSLIAPVPSLCFCLPISLFLSLTFSPPILSSCPFPFPFPCLAPSSYPSSCPIPIPVPVFLSLSPSSSETHLRSEHFF
jgi:hypothetical protein